MLLQIVPHEQTRKLSFLSQASQSFLSIHRDLSVSLQNSKRAIPPFRLPRCHDCPQGCNGTTLSTVHVARLAIGRLMSCSTKAGSQWSGMAIAKLPQICKLFTLVKFAHCWPCSFASLKLALNTECYMRCSLRLQGQQIHFLGCVFLEPLVNAVTFSFHRTVHSMVGSAGFANWTD